MQNFCLKKDFIVTFKRRWKFGGIEIFISVDFIRILTFYIGGIIKLWFQELEADFDAF